MESLVADIQRVLSAECSLLGPLAATASSFSLNWGGDGKLRLPRIKDSLFGVSLHFPDNPNTYALAASLDKQAPSLNSEQGAPDCPSSPAKAKDLPDDLIEECLIDSRSCANENDIEAMQEDADDENNSECSMSTIERGNTARHQECDEHLAKDMDKSLQNCKDGNFRLASVQEILASHSRAEIYLELKWARQALRDRRKVRLLGMVPATHTSRKFYRVNGFTDCATNNLSPVLVLYSIFDPKVVLRRLVHKP